MFRYAMNIDLTKHSIDNGYLGGWLDCFSASQFSPYLMDGMKIIILLITAHHFALQNKTD